MESNKLSPKINITNLSDILNGDSKYIPIKRIKSYIFPDNLSNFILYDYNTNKIINKISSSDNYFIFSINKIMINNISYLIISSSEKINKSLINYNNLLFRIKDKALKKEENSLIKCLEEEIHKVIILDNKDVVALRNREYISYYIYNNSNYKKFFNNLNKDGYIFGLIKLTKNNFCFLSLKSLDTFKFTLFDENFFSKEKEIKMMKPSINIKNNIFFKVNKGKIIIIGNFEFIIFDPILLEIQTIINTGLICGVLPFNKRNNDYNEIYHYFALIILENKHFYIKFYSFFDYIKETEKMDLNQLYPEFEKLIFDNNSSNVHKQEKNRNEKKEYKNIYFHIIKENKEYYMESILFDMFYDVKNNGDIILIIDIIRGSGEKKLKFSLDFNINNLLFM